MLTHAGRGGGGGVCRACKRHRGASASGVCVCVCTISTGYAHTCSTSGARGRAFIRHILPPLSHHAASGAYAVVRRMNVAMWCRVPGTPRALCCFYNRSCVCVSVPHEMRVRVCGIIIICARPGRNTARTCVTPCFARVRVLLAVQFSPHGVGKGGGVWVRWWWECGIVGAQCANQLI